MRLALALLLHAALLASCAGGEAPGAGPAASPAEASPAEASPAPARTPAPTPQPSLAACLASDGSSPGVEAAVAASIAGAAAERFPRGGVLSSWKVVPGSVSARQLGGALYEYSAEYEVEHAHPGERPLLTERLAVSARIDASSCQAEITALRP